MFQPPKRRKPYVRSSMVQIWCGYTKLDLEIDRISLERRGLKMPKLTKKYLLAVKLATEICSVVPFHLHLNAARMGLDWFYELLKKNGYCWNQSKNVWEKLEPGQIF